MNILKFHLLAFFEGSIALHTDRGEVRKNVISALLGGYKPVTFGIAEPLYDSNCHAFHASCAVWGKKSSSLRVFQKYQLTCHK